MVDLDLGDIIEYLYLLKIKMDLLNMKKAHGFGRPDGSSGVGGHETYGLGDHNRAP
jgi:hypothetical protein